jgi:hypothetical protein
MAAIMLTPATGAYSEQVTAVPTTASTAMHFAARIYVAAFGQWETYVDGDVFIAPPPDLRKNPTLVPSSN